MTCMAFLFHWKLKMRVILLGLSFFLSGCALFEDISPQNRHSYWLASMRNEVGRSIFNCDTHRRCRQNLFHSEITLENGNKEAVFFMPHRKEPRCRYYFEYEAASGKIVGYRYEESEPFSCADIW